jgi:hypothetical protein
MLGRPKINAAAPFRSSIADAAFAVEQRLVWKGADLLRRIADAIKWPFERAVWTIERGVVWPIEERTDGWDESLRTASAGGLALLAAGAVALGVVLASGGGSTTRLGVVSAPAPTPVTPATQPESESVLHGTAPDFTAASDEAASKGGSSTEVGAETTAQAGDTTLESSPQATAAPVVAAGPAATKVAHRFAGAFVLYETGKTSPKVRATFAETATPQLTRDLLRRPPRLPANTEVPKAKVVNIVPGPKRGDTYTMSISLLRVGITSELRIDVGRDEKSGEFKVEHIDG